MERFHHHFLFFLRLVYVAVAQTGDVAAVPVPCDSTWIAEQISYACTDHLERPTPVCCEFVVGSVSVGMNAEVPCLCLVAQEPGLAAGGLNIHDILRLYDACGGVRPGLPRLAASCKAQDHALLELKKQNEELQKKLDKAEKAKTAAQDELENYKIKTQSQIQAFTEQIEFIKASHEEVESAVRPLIDFLCPLGAGTSTCIDTHVLDRQKSALEKLKKYIKETVVMGSYQALAVVKSLHPRVDFEVVGEGFAYGTSEERALELINEVKSTADALVKNLDL